MNIFLDALFFRPLLVVQTIDSLVVDEKTRAFVSSWVPVGRCRHTLTRFSGDRCPNTGARAVAKALTPSCAYGPSHGVSPKPGGIGWPSF